MLNQLVARRAFVRMLPLCAMLVILSAGLSAQTPNSIYDEINAFNLSGETANVTDLVIKRDRVTMSFTGTFYFARRVDGRSTGAVFIGKGTLSAGIPPSDFEKSNVRRLLKADEVSSDFTSAVMRFVEDPEVAITKDISNGTVSPAALKLAAEFEPRIRKETGANIASRLTQAIVNNEGGGFFIGTFDGGGRGRFSYIFDPVNRIPTANFDINGGEKGLIFAYKQSIYSSEVWTAFYGENDYARRMVTYSDVFDLVNITHYDMELDLRTPKSKIGLRTKVSMTARFPGVQALPLNVGESLGEMESSRLKKQMRVKAARIDGKPIAAVQEDWEGGLTVFLPQPTTAGQKLEIELDLEGDFLQQWQYLDDCSFPRSNSTWYPRHGYLDRATYDFRYIHSKRLKVASVGLRESESPWPENPEMVITKYKMDQPVALATFALGPWQRHTDTVKWEGSDRSTPLEFNSISGGRLPIKEDFILAELNNSVRYFNMLFGAYPYATYSATFHPYGFGQGFPSMLMIPPADRANKYTYAFISHETAHQWWGNIVAWRSYRDQWLSEGFAEYSGVLYTQTRQNHKAASNLIDEMRESLKAPPETQTGLGKGRLVDIGPIILGHRLNTSKTFGGYQTLVYNKGALVLRMIHSLLTDPVSGNGQPFFDMMKDFVERHRNKAASTDDFRNVANEHFARSPIARRYQIKDLNWFFDQWVYNTELPSYRMEYNFESQPDGTTLFTGNIIQENVPDDWFMVLPVKFNLGGDRSASGTVHALGPKTPFRLKLPVKPVSAELDPGRWVLSEKTSTK